MTLASQLAQNPVNSLSLPLFLTGPKLTLCMFTKHDLSCPRVNQSIEQNFCKYYMKSLPYLIRLHEIHVPRYYNNLFYYCLTSGPLTPLSLCMT